MNTPAMNCPSDDSCWQCLVNALLETHGLFFLVCFPPSSDWAPRGQAILLVGGSEVDPVLGSQWWLDRS